MTLLATEQSAWVHSALKENVKVKVRGRPWMSAVTAAIEKSSSSCVSFQTAAVSSHGAPLTGRSSAKTPSEKFICCHSGTKKKHPDQMKETLFHLFPKSGPAAASLLVASSFLLSACAHTISSVADAE